MKTTLTALYVMAAPALPALAADHGVEISITNPLARDRTDAPVAVGIASLGAPFAPKSAIVSIDGREVPSQLDDLDRDGVADELAFVVDIPASATLKAEISLSDQPSDRAYPPRAFAQMLVRGYQDEIVPIGDISVAGDVDSYTLLYGHGAMLESELNGYRIYFDPKQTLDPYGKYAKGLELAESQFYPTDEQLARGFGDDVLMVGSTCGIGALKGWSGTEATHIAPVSRRGQRVVASGPVRAIVEVDDLGWRYGDACYDMTQRYTQWAGHRDVRIDIMLDRPLGDEEFAVGTQKIFGDETVHSYGPAGTVASWGRYWPVGDTVRFDKVALGMAVCLPEGLAKAKAQDAGGWYFIVRAPGRSRFGYNAQFTCSKETYGFPDAQSWMAYSAIWKEDLDNPLEIKINK